MDVVQDWAAYLLSSEHNPYSNPYISKAYRLVSTLKSLATPLINQLTNKPDLATIALLLIIILLSLKLLNMLWQTVKFWFRLAKTIFFWGSIVFMGVWLYSRGVDGVVEDAEYWQAQWSDQYGYWKEKEKMARLAHQGVNYGRQQAAQRGWF